MFGLVKDAVDANMQVVSRNNSGSVTKIDLGPSFPGTGSAIGYRATFTINLDGTVDYEVTHLVSGAVASGSISENLPAISTAMYGGVWFGTATSQTVKGSIIGLTMTPTLQ